MNTIICHNPLCSKSLEALKLLEEQNIIPKIRLYLQEHPSVKELKNIVYKIVQPISELIIFNKSVDKELGLSSNNTRYCFNSVSLQFIFNSIN
jgi:arsenate reductase-like glutaredoxin family protein